MVEATASAKGVSQPMKIGCREEGREEAWL